MNRAKPKYRSAVGLEYDERRDAAPNVVVKGSGAEADEVIRLAKRFGIPVVEHSELAQALDPVPLDQSIPERLFRAVALILSRLKKR